MLNLLLPSLEKEGFGVEIVKSGEAALAFISKEVPALIILEIVLPGLDGVELCRALRELPAIKDTIIIFLTVRGESYSEVAAFEAGADDYIVKPLRLRAFMIRILTLLNRRKGITSPIIPQKPAKETNHLIIDKERMVSIKNGQTIQWQYKEFKLLTLLSSRPEKVFSRSEIFRAIWGIEDIANERLIDVYIRRIRKKIGSDHIITIFGQGYQFVD